MDSQYHRDGRYIIIVDRKWKRAIRKLPFEDIKVPIMELPDIEQENGNSTKTLKEQEYKWNDLALIRISENYI
jgi:anaphase-promoting complex subunit 13